MSRPAARRLARYYRRIGIACRILRSTAPNGLHSYAVERL
jgi:hypothetical protein